MPTDAKVVQLNKAAPAYRSGSPAGRLPVAIANLRDKAAQQFKLAFQALFDNADDSLFQMADRATSDTEQNTFFEAMRDLRLKRRAVERSFMLRLFESFSTLNQCQIGAPAPQREEISRQPPTLVQNHKLKESVAVSTMIGKVMNRDAVQLTHLTTRLNALVRRKLDDTSNPLGPHNLCSCFLHACQGLGTDIRIKLVLLKLFEKYVLADLGQLYGKANQSLIAIGILPELQALPPGPHASHPLHARELDPLRPQPQPKPSGLAETSPPATLDIAPKIASASPSTTGTSPLIGPPLPALIETSEKIVLPTLGETRESEPGVSLPDTDASLQQVDRLRVGCWVEFQQGEERKQRCKLAAVIKPTGKYVFVNRNGMKVMEKTRQSLAMAFRDNVIRLLDDTLLFDRALESVIGNLRQLKSDA